VDRSDRSGQKNYNPINFGRQQIQIKLSLIEKGQLCLALVMEHTLLHLGMMGVDRYSVLVEFEDQKSTNRFYIDVNGCWLSYSKVAKILKWVSTNFICSSYVRLSDCSLIGEVCLTTSIPLILFAVHLLDCQTDV
jgi:hypothetical protein